MIGPLNGANCSQIYLQNGPQSPPSAYSAPFVPAILLSPTGVRPSFFSFGPFSFIYLASPRCWATPRRPTAFTPFGWTTRGCYATHFVGFLFPSYPRGALTVSGLVLTVRGAHTSPHSLGPPSDLSGPLGYSFTQLLRSCIAPLRGLRPLRGAPTPLRVATTLRVAAPLRRMRRRSRRSVAHLLRRCATRHEERSDDTSATSDFVGLGLLAAHMCARGTTCGASPRVWSHVGEEPRRAPSDHRRSLVRPSRSSFGAVFFLRKK